MIKSYQVFDNFLDTSVLDVPSLVRDSAIHAGFGNWTPGKDETSASLDGMGFGGNHAILTKALMNATGVIAVPNLTHFRLTTKHTERATIHSDAHAGPYTCIAYLTQNKNQGATAFWRHKETGLTGLPLDLNHLNQETAAMLRDDMAKSSMEDWEITDIVKGEYNRALVFNAPLFHCRYPMEDPGTDLESGRLVWVCHYFNLQEMK